MRGQEEEQRERERRVRDASRDETSPVSEYITHDSIQCNCTGNTQKRIRKCERVKGSGQRQKRKTSGQCEREHTAGVNNE